MFLKRYIYCAVYAYNAVGTVIANTDSNGLVIRDNDFDAYGIELRGNDYSGSQVAGIGTSQNDLLFSTKERDFSIGLDNHGFRYYDSELGRYLTRDPAGYPNNFNNYLYVSNNPINGIDPLGLEDVIKSLTWLEYNVGKIQSWMNHTDKGRGTVIMAKSIDTASDVAVPTKGAIKAGAKTALKNSGKIINAVKSPLKTAKKLKEGAKQLVKEGGKLVDKAKQGYKDLKDKFTGKKPNKPNTTTKVAETKKCFTAGTLILVQNSSAKIEDIQVGQRVLTNESFEGNKDYSTGLKVIPADYRLLELHYQNPDDKEDVFVFKVLRHIDWINAKECKVGGMVDITYEEDLKVDGLAKVVAIDTCPEIETGEGHLVLMTVKHLHRHVLSMSFEDTDEVVEITPLHKIYSADLNDWIEAGKVKAGHKLKTAKGTLTVASLSKLKGVHAVYNFEVDIDHHYFVGKFNLLAHNSCDDYKGDKTGFTDSTKGSGPEKVGDDGYWVEADPKTLKPYKKNKKQRSGDKRKDDVPSDYKNSEPYRGEKGKDYAERVLKDNDKYDPKDTGPASDFNKVKKSGDNDYED